MIKRLIKKIYFNDKSNYNLTEQLNTIKEKNKAQDSKKILSFASGRSGQRWMTSIFGSHINSSAVCEPMHEFEAFFRYVTWNKINIDLEPFYIELEKKIEKDLTKSNYSLLASPYFAFGIEELHERINPNYIFYHIRNPKEVINSLYVKGWYIENPIRKNSNCIHGIQPHWSTSIHHSLGRIIPKNDEIDEWNKLTRIGKITWYYKTINKHIIHFLENIPDENKWIFKLSEIDQNYDYYIKLAKSFKLSPLLSRKEFMTLKGNQINRAKHKRNFDDWSNVEKKDFNFQIEDLLEYYEKINSTKLK